MHGRILYAACTEINSRRWTIICSEHIEDSLIGIDEWEKVCILLVSLTYILLSSYIRRTRIIHLESWMWNRLYTNAFLIWYLQNSQSKSISDSHTTVGITCMLLLSSGVLDTNTGISAPKARKQQTKLRNTYVEQLFENMIMRVRDKPVKLRCRTTDIHN